MTGLLAGLLSCGSEAEGDAPVMGEALSCPEGYLATGGDGLHGVCAPRMPVTIHGFLSALGSGEAVANATVTVVPAVDGELVTDADGYFRIDDVPFVGDVSLVFRANGYVSGSVKVHVPLQTGDGLARLYVDASATLAPLADVTTRRVSGYVYAGVAPADGAVVHLFDHEAGQDVDTMATDAEGAFSVEAVTGAGHQFSLRIDPLDADGDGVSEYQYTELWLGRLDRADDEPGADPNLSNIVVVLELTAKDVAYASFLPPVTHLEAGELAEGVRLPAADSDIILHFGAEADPATFEVEMIEWLDGFIGGAVAMDASWNDSGTVVTLDPVEPLDADADLATLYELRIRGLFWSDGTTFVLPGGAVDQAARIRFDVFTPAALPTSPIPAVHLAPYFDEAQTVAQVRGDSRVLWRLDETGSPFNGFTDPADPAASDAYFNSASGLQLEWLAVKGAADYRIYARQTWEGPGASALRGWREVEADIAWGLEPGAKVIASDVLLAAPPLWNDFGAGTLGGQVGNPLAFGNEIQLAVTLINEQGAESSIDEAKALRLQDQMPAQIVSAESWLAGDEVFADAVERGCRGVSKVMRVGFSELIDPTAPGTWTAASGNIIELRQPEVVSWDGGMTMTSETPSDEAIYASLGLDFRGACSVLGSDAAETGNTIFVHDTSLFASGDSLFFLDTAGSALAIGATKEILLVDQASKSIQLTTTLAADGGGAVKAGQFVCRAEVDDEIGAELAGPYAVGEPRLAVSAPGIFHPSQEVLVFTTSPAIQVAVATVKSVMAPVYGPGGGLLVSGQLQLAGSMGIDADSGIVIPRPLDGELGFRMARPLTLRQTVTTAAATDRLHFTIASMEGTTIMEDDLLMVDVDGDAGTLGDRYVMRVGTVNMSPDDDTTPTVDETDYRCLIKPAQGQSVALPGGLVLDPAVTVVVHLGDSLGFSGYQDTSGNIGLHQHANQFSFCDGALPWCRGGVLVY